MQTLLSAPGQLHSAAPASYFVSSRPCHFPLFAGLLLAVGCNPELGAIPAILPNTVKLNSTHFAGQVPTSQVQEALAPPDSPEALGFGGLITIQSVGLTFATPVRFTLPNVDGVPSGTQLDLQCLNAGTRPFVVVTDKELPSGLAGDASRGPSSCPTGGLHNRGDANKK